MAEWSTPDDVAARLRPRWRSGELLRACAEGRPFEPVEVRLRGPRARELGADLERVRRWAERLERAAPGRYELVREPVGVRTVGRNDLPARAVVTGYEQAWRLLDVGDEAGRHARLVGLLAGDPDLRSWALAQPHAALGVEEAHWPGLLAALEWLRAARGSGRFLREISAPGVDTKLVERHRGLLAAVLGVPGAADDFVEVLGLRVRPARVRLRLGEALLPGSSWAALRDVTAPVEQLAALPVAPAAAVVLENETTFLAAPLPPRGVAVFGEGFRVSRLGSLPWLRDVPVHYWGDLDTHGFAILDRLRAWLPQTTSFLMDRDTLLAHRERWGSEPSPTTAALTRLTDAEQATYEDLVSDRYADRVRLEQERIDWAWALERWPDGTAG
ncbi:Wadjet anti-phage system protein JetD domain-containing protein [Nocardioides sp. 31GB23]|uniref:DUF3322 and DUF2220 domain-containing protein n=1 Tax=Nocardioides salarius TaxID=374513 RepID=A0ABS2M8W2_9ACTN|nr:DUF3322 and DUF2220 domain-containing protein [Nocardioides salarius]MBM7507605.1 hypothetical protein [Nocardioides salarius]